MNPMKPERPNEDQEPVRRILRDWNVTSPLPPRFAERVWQQIERAERGAVSPPGPTVWAWLKAWVSATLPRPAFAVVYVSVLLFAGLAAGYWQASLDTRNWETTLARRYMQAVDPFQNTAHE